MLKEEFDISFYLLDSIGFDINTIVDPAFTLIKIEDESIFLDALTGKEIVILDGYHFDTFYQKQIKEKGCLLICIDDLYDKHFLADIVLNHTPGIVEGSYSAESYTTFLLGPEYVLLRPGFLKQAAKPRELGAIHSLVICFGGSDPNNLTCSTLLNVVPYLAFKKITVITGGGYRFHEQLRIVLDENDKVRHYQSLDQDEMIKCFLDANLAIVPASGILFEAIACKILLISGYYIANQKNIHQGFKSLNTFYDANNFSPSNLKNAIDLALTGDHNNEMIFNQYGCIDGHSSSRILEKLVKKIYERNY